MKNKSQTRRLSTAGALILWLVVTPAAIACLWDYDILKMERQRFPDALELIAGKFLRHSEEFYVWRIEDRRKLLETDRDGPRVRDDLAVALDKTGRSDEAVELMIASEELWPGRYETAANLGTFYIHGGQLAEGLRHIERAIAINPDAHFGREIYQAHVVRYVLARRDGDLTRLPLGRQSEKPTSFMAWLGEELGLEGDALRTERDSALKGVLGMMRFGTHDSPVLLEIVGDILSYDHQDDAKQLAARAYLHASYVVSNEGARDAYRELAERCLSMQTPAPNTPEQLELTALEAEFQTELAQARDWYAGVRNDELSWIEAGQNPEVEFDRKYYQEPAPSESATSEPSRVAGFRAEYVIVVLIGVILICLPFLRRARSQ